MGGIGALEAEEVLVQWGGIGAARAERVGVEFGSVGAALAGELHVSQGFAGSVVAREATVGQGIVRTLIAQRVTVTRPTGVLVMIAARVEGEVRPVLDWRGALVAGLAIGLVSAAAKVLRERAVAGAGLAPLRGHRLGGREHPGRLRGRPPLGGSLLVLPDHVGGASPRPRCGPSRSASRGCSTPGPSSCRGSRARSPWPPVTSSPTRCLDFSRNAASPVERTSSSSRMSGSTDVAIEKPSRARMPDEYVLIGASMNSPRSA